MRRSIALVEDVVMILLNGRKKGKYSTLLYLRWEER
jgi:hypothetical protein